MCCVTHTGLKTPLMILEASAPKNSRGWIHTPLGRQIASPVAVRALRGIVLPSSQIANRTALTETSSGKPEAAHRLADALDGISSGSLIHFTLSSSA